MVREYACRKCKSLASGKICPTCNSTDLSKDWAGLIIILDPEKSEVAKSTKHPPNLGKYATKSKLSLLIGNARNIIAYHHPDD